MIIKADQFVDNKTAAANLRLVADRLEQGKAQVTHCRIIPEDPYLLLELRYVDKELEQELKIKLG